MRGHQKFKIWELFRTDTVEVVPCGAGELEPGKLEPGKSSPPAPPAATGATAES